MRWAVFAAIAVLLVVALVREGPELRDALRELSPWNIVAAGMVLVAGLVASMFCWRALLAGLGSSLPVRPAARLFFMAQLGKYLPGGSVWPLLAQMELGREHKIPAARSAAAFGLTMILNLATGIVIAGVGLAVSNSGGFAHYWWILLPLPIFLCFLHPAVLDRFVALALRLIRRPVVRTRLAVPALLVATGWSVVVWVAFGAQVTLLADGVGADGHRLFLLCTSAFALAWVVGFLVMVAPAGAGTREVVLVVTLSPVLSRPAALVVALVARVLTIIADLLVVAVSVLAARSHRREMPADLAAEEEPSTATAGQEG